MLSPQVSTIGHENESEGSPLEISVMKLGIAIPDQRGHGAGRRIGHGCLPVLRRSRHSIDTTTSPDFRYSIYRDGRETVKPGSAFIIGQRT
jgi:hypothetical protein